MDGFMGRFGALRENPWEEPEIWGQTELPPGRVWQQEGPLFAAPQSFLVGDDRKPKPGTSGSCQDRFLS